MEKKLQDLTDTELKAMAYDLLALLQRAQQDLIAINNELTRRVAPAQSQVQTSTLA